MQSLWEMWWWFFKKLKIVLLYGPWKKSYDKPRQLIKEQRHYFPTKVVKAMVFPVVMYGCDTWTIRKAECQRTDALNCGVGEDLRVLGLKGDPTSPS